MSTPDTPTTPQAKEAGVRRLPQYITEQLLLAIDNVRQGRMRSSELEFETCSIIVAKSGLSVQVLITERSSEAQP